MSAVHFSPGALLAVCENKPDGFIVRCVHCVATFLACRQCYRRRTCSSDCKTARRRATARASQGRYRGTPGARRDHAAHQATYRAKRRRAGKTIAPKIVRDHRRRKLDVDQDAAPREPASPKSSVKPEARTFAARCAFCEREIGAIVRRGRGPRSVRFPRRPRFPNGPAPPGRQRDHSTRH